MANEVMIDRGWQDVADMVGAELVYQGIPDALGAEIFWRRTRDFFEGEGYQGRELLSLEVMAERTVKRFNEELNDMGVRE